jgi:hypothetical protein
MANPVTYVISGLQGKLHQFFMETKRNTKQ